MQAGPGKVRSEVTVVVEVPGLEERSLVIGETSAVVKKPAVEL